MSCRGWNRRGSRISQALIAFTREHGIDCDLEETGTLGLADQPYQVDEFRAWVDEAAEHGEHLVFLDRDAAQDEVHSPLWHAGLYRPPGRDVLLDPAKLCRGLARVARERGVAVHEHTPRDRRRATGRRRHDHDGRRRLGPSGGGRRRDIGLLGLAASPLAAVRAGLRLRPRVRSADARPARGHRLGTAPGPQRREQPVSLLPAHRRRPHPVGRLRRDPPFPQPGRAGARRPAADASSGSRRSSSGRSRSWMASRSRIAGAGRSTRPRGSPSRSARRWVAG